jgi:hypothetical protein
MDTVAWAIWYGDGEVLRGNLPEEADTAPTTDVQAVVMYHPNEYRTIQMGLSEPDDGPAPYRVPGSSWQGTGEWMDDQAYPDLIARALEE